ncbi:MAG: hypothetical protein ACK5Q5_04540 [Planctomycetaceae bacterium]
MIPTIRHRSGVSRAKRTRERRRLAQATARFPFKFGWGAKGESLKRSDLLMIEHAFRDRRRLSPLLTGVLVAAASRAACDQTQSARTQIRAALALIEAGDAQLDADPAGVSEAVIDEALDQFRRLSAAADPAWLEAFLSEINPGDECPDDHHQKHQH